MPSRRDTIFCVTSVGGPIGTVTITGERPLALAKTIFRPKKGGADFAAGKLRYGWVCEDDEVVDEALVCYWRRHPRWRCEAVELHLHGGRGVIERVKGMLKKRGAVGLGPSAFFAFLWRRGHICALQREAEEVLLNCRAPRGALVALNWPQLKDLLLQTACLPAQQARVRLLELLESAPCGIAATKPKQFLIAGPPNSGKSSLLNALIERTRCIVHPEPGTTVDVITVRMEIDGYEIFVSDSAGVCGDEGLWRAAMERLQREIARCDFVIWLHDTSRPPTEEDMAVQEMLKGKSGGGPLGLDPERVVAIMSKTDLPPVWRPEKWSVATSAVRKEGIEELRRLLVRLATGGKPWRLPCLFTQRQINLCRRALREPPETMAALIKRIVEGSR